MNDATIPHNRIRILTLFMLVMMLVFVGRLFYMQIIQHDEYVAKAQEEQIKSRIIPAERGEIYGLDNGEPIKLVLNQAVFTAFVDPLLVKEPEKIIRSVKQVAGGTTVKNIKELVYDTPRRYHVIAHNLTYKQAQLLKKKKLLGLGFQQATQRVYPEGKLAAQILGFVNAAGAGQYGVEGQLDDRLKGKDGLLRSVTDVSNVPLTIGKQNTEIPAKDGENVVLTIDRSVQSYAEQALRKGMNDIGATEGSVLVMDPQSGSVLAMANYPSFNPAKFSKVTNARAFSNATISEPYEPASVIKTFMAATAIEKGVMKPSDTYVNRGVIEISGIPIHNAVTDQLGTITMQHALNWSLNTGSVTWAQRLGGGSITKSARNTMYHYYHDMFGLGQLTGIELAGENPGTVIAPDDPSGEGNAFRYANMTFGQGLNVTMLQVAAGFSSLVNGGKYYQPTVIAGTVNEDGAYQPKAATTPLRRTISESTSRTVKRMIHDARNAFYSSQDKPGFDIGGKTGTSETLVNGKYTKNQTIGTYIGYGGDTKPRYVIMVQVSAPGRAFAGNTEAMPIFTDISNWMIGHLELRPR